MVPRTAGVGAGVLGFALALVHLAPGYVTDRLLNDAPGWLPRLGSTGETALLYAYSSRGAAFLVGTLGVLALGYRAGRRLDLPADFERFVRDVGGGGAVGYVVASALFVLAAMDGASTADAGLLTVAVWSGRVVGVGIQFAVVGFAGAAFAVFVGRSGRGSDPTRTSGDGDARAGSPD